MKEPFIFLCSEISRENALTLIKWLKDEEVIKYLSDSKSVSDDIEQVINRVNLPVLTHIFNQNGTFYIAYNKHNHPLGFVRLVFKDDECEIVIAIGDRDNWNKRYGTSVLRESIRTAFFEFRTRKIIAKIYKDNKRSIHVFIKTGFSLESETPRLKIFSLTMENYLKLLKGEPTKSNDIYITGIDKDRIKKILDKSSELNLSYMQDSSIEKLEGELNRAVIVNSQQVPKDVITMNSKVLLDIDNVEREISLVYPKDDILNEKELSVFSPVGTAILGYKEGNTIEWEVKQSIIKIHIKKVLYQPEAAGDYHL